MQLSAQHEELKSSHAVILKKREEEIDALKRAGEEAQKAFEEEKVRLGETWEKATREKEEAHELAMAQLKEEHEAVMVEVTAMADEKHEKAQA